ncbi:MAG: DUF4430 domain-containing protein [Candidatus Omnitrophica bacterium]|nr:DUF4430 domain-containing protein [Candidatus Omnitrophota bacterium]
MGRIAKLIIAVVLCILPVTTLESWADDQVPYVNDDSKNIVVEIDYGDVRPSRTVEVSLVRDRTVLEVLQTVATVETHPVGQYVFVISIDGVEGKRGEMAWYYTVDGKSVGKLAYSNVLGGAKCIRWTYKKDICSGKVDEQK